MSEGSSTVEKIAQSIDARVNESTVQGQKNLVSGAVKLVHYTSASNLLKIIRGKQIWLRNARMMNDFAEIHYGNSLLRHGFASMAGGHLKKFLDSSFTIEGTDFYTEFDRYAHDLNYNTFIFSLSEHEVKLDDMYGRLSMWRAYAPKNGVSLVVNIDPFVAETNILKCYSFKVNYHSPSDAEKLFEDLLQMLPVDGEIEFFEKQHIVEVLKIAFYCYILSTKHPAFEEEREWRVISSPIFGNSDIPIHSVEDIGGIPQRVVSLPLQNSPELGLHKADINNLVYKILIGATEYQEEIRTAIVKELVASGAEDAEDRVVSTSVPLRIS